MTYLAYKRLTTRRKNAKIEARNQQRRTLKELAERRGDTPNKNYDDVPAWISMRRDRT